MGSMTHLDTRELKVLLKANEDQSTVDTLPPIAGDGGGHGGSREQTLCGRMRRFLRQHLFIWLNIVGIATGFALAFGLRKVGISQDAITWISLPGDVFLRLLKMTIIPLIVANVIAGSSSVDPASNGRAGLLALVYTVINNFISSIIGVLLAVAIKPGVGLLGFTVDRKVATTKVKTQDVFIDLIRNMFPDNIVRATLQKVQTTYREEPRLEKAIADSLNISANNTNSSGADTAVQLIRHIGYAESTNILGLLFFCGVFGVAVGILQEKAAVINHFFHACADTMLVILGWFVWTSPFGIGSLIFAAIISVPNLEDMFAKVGLFVLLVTGGIVFQYGCGMAPGIDTLVYPRVVRDAIRERFPDESSGRYDSQYDNRDDQLLMFPAIFFAFLRRNPYPIIPASVRAWAIAFASSGSACAMPEMFRVVEDRGCDRRLSSLTVPISVTLNASGSSLFITAAVVFLAQIGEFSLTVPQYIVIGSLTALSSLVLPSVPSASIVTVVMVLTTLSMSPQNVGILFTVEWFLDRIRTTSNVMCEIFGVIIIDHFCKTKIRTSDIEPA